MVAKVSKSLGRRVCETVSLHLSYPRDSLPVSNVFDG